jgi:fucose 4-O-acetylase-like acetyltransferase
MRLTELDILKGIGILLVIICHTFMKEIGPYITAFHMPLFFIVAGYFYKQNPFNVHLKKDFRRLVVPYLFICIVIMLIASVQESRANHDVSIVTDVLYECGTPAWFLLGLFGSRTIFNRVLSICPNHYMIVSLVISSIPFAISLYDELSTTLSFFSSICGVIFVAIGYYVKQYHVLEFLDSHKATAVTLSILLWLNTSILGAVDLHYSVFKLWIIDYLGACGGTYLCYSVSKFVDMKTTKLKAILVWWGYFSFVVFSFHAIEYVFPNWHVLASFSDNSPIRPYVILLFRLFFAWLAVFVTMRISILKNIFFPEVKIK